MNSAFLQLPARTARPRQNGLTVVIDNGLPTRLFEDYATSFVEYIDHIKLGWCTAVVTPGAHEKAKIARNLGIDLFLGGTFFEKALYQNKLDQFVEYVRDLGCTTIEVSNGTIDLPNLEKAKHIRALTEAGFSVVSEVGYKDVMKSRDLSPARWIEYINQDLQAGAKKVITEARESGKSGICRENGELRFGLIKEIFESGIKAENLIFEAPNKGLQEYFISSVGTNVNLANIAFTDIVGVETLRLGLRSDTLLHFELGNEKDAKRD